ncbi:hypothetical protein D3C87_1317380 [compost metagenome]
MFQRSLTNPENGGDVDVEGHHPFFIGDVFELFVGHLERGVVHQNIDTAETLDGFFHQCPAMHLVRQVTGQQQALTAGLFDPACGFFGIFLFVEVGNRYIGAFTGEGDGDRAANSAVATGNQGDLAIQTTRALVALLAAIGIRVHLALRAGHGLLLFGEGWFWVVVHHPSPFSRLRSQRVDPGVLA